MKRIVVLLFILWIMPVSARALTLNELMVRSKLLLAQDTAATTVTWSSTELRYWINAAIRTIAGLSESVERDTSIALVERKWEYSMPSDFVRVGDRGIFLFKKGSQQALDRDPKGLTPKDGATFGRDAVSGAEPTQYIDMGRSLRRVALSPTPTTAGDSMRVTFVSYGNVYTTDTSSVECVLPPDLEEIIPMYVRYRAKKKYVVEGPYWNEFVQELQLIVPTLGPIRQEQVPAASPGPGVTP